MDKTMFEKLFNSIVFRIGSMMFAISLIAILSMFSSMFISELADKDALLINHAGSMRMQSYKILAELELLPQLSDNLVVKHQQRLKLSINHFSQKITNPIMSADSQPSLFLSTTSALAKIKEHWFSQLAPELEQLTEQPQLLSVTRLVKTITMVNQFVVRVDHLVSLYQQRAEQRISLIRLILGGSLLVTTLLAGFIMVQINRRVEKPLSELTSAAKQIIAGDYTATVNITQTDELGLLAKTMNTMSQAISQSHAHLATEVRAKTLKLQQSNDSLALLYQTSQSVNQTEHVDLTPIAQKLANITGIADIDICLTTLNGKQPYEHVMTTDKMLAERCQQKACEDCLTKQGCEIDVSEQAMIIRYPINKDEISYGVIVCSLAAKMPLETWQHQLLSSIAALLANGLHTRQQNEQNRRIALLNERTVIARELHDSLAQALSYLKMQVSCLQKLQKKQAPEVQINAVVDELKHGLNSAYRQLRELLTTFRLKIAADGLKQAFAETIEQLNKRNDGTMQFVLDYHIHGIPLSPNEEIHLLQITREATQNALHHSQASRVVVTVHTDIDHVIHLTVEDNGIGMPDDTNKLNHYGLAIMQERSQHLNGALTLSNGALGGTKVAMCFSPKYLNHQTQVA